VITLQDLEAELNRAATTMDGPAPAGTCVMSRHEVMATIHYLRECLQLRAERVKLQGENEELRHDLKALQQAADDGMAPTKTATELGFTPYMPGAYIIKRGDQVRMRACRSAGNTIEIDAGVYDVLGADVSISEGSWIIQLASAQGTLAWVSSGHVEAVRPR
jgi:hypothetical protein